MKSRKMSPRLQQKLFEQFPWIKPDESDRQSPWTLFGFEVGNGWFLLLQGLFEEIEELFKIKGFQVTLRIGQVKGKFGELRVYFDFENDELFDEVYEIALKYRNLSKTVCYNCGGQGSHRQIIGWWTTLCDSCYEIYNKQAHLRAERNDEKC